MDLRTTFAALRSGWHLIFIGILAAASVAIWLEETADPVYSATASYVVSPGSGIAPDDVARGVDTLDSSRSRSIMTTLTEITDSEATRTDAFTALGVDLRLLDAYEVESVVVPEANVMQTTVTGPDPIVAKDLASSLGRIGGVRFVEAYQIYEVDVLDAATLPDQPSNPGLVELMTVASAMGIAAGAALALLRWSWINRSGRTVRNRLGAYNPRISTIEEHARFKRAG